MHLTVNAGELAAALKLVKPAIAGRANIPILSHILLDARDGRLTISGTNLETSLRTSIAADVIQAGRTTALESKLSAWAALQPRGAEATLKADGKGLTLLVGRDRAKLGVADPDDYPPLPEINGQSFTLPADVLARGLAMTLPSVATKDAERPVLRGLSVTVDGRMLKLAAADGYRLGIATIELPEAAARPASIIVPQRSVAALQGLLAVGGDVLVRIAEHGRQVAFTAGETSLWSGLIEGLFPDYQRIIPTEVQATATVNAAALERQVRAAQLVGTDTPVRFRTDAEAGSLTVWARDTDVEHEGSIDAEVVGESLEVALSASYALNAIQVLESEQVEIWLNGPTQPVLFCAPGGADAALQIVMPRHERADNQPVRGVAA